MLTCYFSPGRLDSSGEQCSWFSGKSGEGFLGGPKKCTKYLEKRVQIFPETPPPQFCKSALETRFEKWPGLEHTWGCSSGRPVTLIIRVPKRGGFSAYFYKLVYMEHRENSTFRVSQTPPPTPPKTPLFPPFFSPFPTTQPRTPKWPIFAPFSPPSTKWGVGRKLIVHHSSSWTSFKQKMRGVGGQFENKHLHQTIKPPRRKIACQNLYLEL